MRKKWREIEAERECGRETRKERGKTRERKSNRVQEKDGRTTVWWGILAGAAVARE